MLVKDVFKHHPKGRMQETVILSLENLGPDMRHFDNVMASLITKGVLFRLVNVLSARLDQITVIGTTQAEIAPLVKSIGLNFDF
jgi:hypothetical protein